MTSKRTIVSATRSSILALSLALLAACGGATQNNASQNNGTAAAAPAVPANAGPVRGALAAFDGVCTRLMDRAAYITAATGAGWETYEATPDSILGRILAFGETAGREMIRQSGRTGEIDAEYATFRQTVNGRELFLVITQMQIPGMSESRECRVYDFAAPAPTDADVTAWTSAPFQKSVEQGVTNYGWQPSFREGFTRIDVTFIEENSPLRAQLPITGLSISAVLAPQPTQQ